MLRLARPDCWTIESCSGWILLWHLLFFNGPIWPRIIFLSFVIRTNIEILWQAAHRFCILPEAKPQGARQLPNSELKKTFACFKVRAVDRSFSSCKAGQQWRPHQSVHLSFEPLSAEMWRDDHQRSKGRFDFVIWSLYRGAQITLTFLPGYPHSPSSSCGSLGLIVCSVSFAGSFSELFLPTCTGVKTETGARCKVSKIWVKHGCLDVKMIQTMETSAHTQTKGCTLDRGSLLGNFTPSLANSFFSSSLRTSSWGECWGTCCPCQPDGQNIPV